MGNATSKSEQRQPRVDSSSSRTRRQLRELDISPSPPRLPSTTPLPSLSTTPTASSEPTEVPTVTPTPWRYKDRMDTLFTGDNEASLKRELINQFDIPNTKRANILLLGPIKAGKSSFINSVASIEKGRMADVSQTGDTETSYTIKYLKYAPVKGFMRNFRIHDCMGIERSSGGFNVSDVKYLVNGNVPKDYQFNPVSPITENDPRFIKDPKEEDKIHCILYVIDAEALFGDIPRELAVKLTRLQDELKTAGIPRTMVLTKIDNICDEVYEDVAMTYRSVAVKNMVEKAHEIFKLPKAHIHPVRNYADSPDMDYKANILILQALQQVLNFAEDYLTQQRSEVEDEEVVYKRAQEVEYKAPEVEQKAQVVEQKAQGSKLRIFEI